MQKNLISIADLSDQEIINIFVRAREFLGARQQISQEKLPLSGKILVNFFFENSTRTRTSFEIAAKSLGCSVINIDISLSSLKKGESVADMAQTINAMSPDFVAIRHNSSGMVHSLARYLEAKVINAGDGTNEHPTQALLDAFVIWQAKKEIAGLEIAICGDVLHSRVARSNLMLLSHLGANIRLIAPRTLIASDFSLWAKKKFNAQIFYDLEKGIKNADVIMMLRIQQERMVGSYIASLGEYYSEFGLNHEKIKLAKKNVKILHPGPINRGVEISSDLADDKKYSLILKQVEAGVAVRKAILLS